MSVASDLTAAQLVSAYWVDRDVWIISLVFLVFLLGINAFSVGAYGELGSVLLTLPAHRTLILFLEYWISSLKMLTIVAFIITGVLVNIGINKSHRYIGTSNWRIPGAPFVGGLGGFAKVFVTASFACKFPHLSLLGNSWGLSMLYRIHQPKSPVLSSV